MTVRPEFVRHQDDGEQALARLAASGDANAFERLYQNHSARVYAVCLRMTGSPQRSAELVQDVFVRVWRRLGTWRADAALSTWIHRIAINLAISHARDEQKRRSREVSVDDSTPAAGDERSHAVSNARLSIAPRSVEDAVDLERAIAALPPGARTVFVLHDVEGYSHEEIARLTGTAAGTCRAQLHRARRLLMENLNR
jgi:RNA polymerase sigma-70 factor (ECF subfamily)